MKLGSRSTFDGLEPDDAPPGYGGVAAVLQAACSPPSPSEREIPEGFGARLADALHQEVERPRGTGMTRRPSVQGCVVALATSTALLGGVAAAGALPAPAQHLAATTLARIGIDVPDERDTDTHVAPAVTTPESESTTEQVDDRTASDAAPPVASTPPTVGSRAEAADHPSPDVIDHSSSTDTTEGPPAPAVSGEPSSGKGHAGDPPGTKHGPQGAPPSAHTDPQPGSKAQKPAPPTPTQPRGNSGNHP